MHRSTYLHVPREWLGELFFAEAAKLKAKNEMLYRHEYLGEVTGTGGAVFSNVEKLEMSDEMIAGFDQMVSEMKVGETRKIVIPPELAYGARGIPEVGISGGEYICFDVTLVK